MATPEPYPNDTTRIAVVGSVMYYSATVTDDSIKPTVVIPVDYFYSSRHAEFIEPIKIEYGDIYIEPEHTDWRGLQHRFPGFTGKSRKPKGYFRKKMPWCRKRNFLKNHR